MSSRRSGMNIRLQNGVTGLTNGVDPRLLRQFDRPICLFTANPAFLQKIKGSRHA